MNTGSSCLAGQFLIAMPGLEDANFSRTVVYLCAHSPEGAMGLVVNRVLKQFSFPDLLAQMEINAPKGVEMINVHFGGPVEAGRGFVLHSTDYIQDSTMTISHSDIALTANVNVLRAMADGSGPKQTLLALGYAGWGPGQLDQEILANGWLNTTADPGIVFDENQEGKWERAMGKLGVDPGQFTGDAGHA